MSANIEHRSSRPGTNVDRPYSLEPRSSLQSLLASLAALDFEHDGDLETVRNSSADGWLKQIVIKKLQERYQEQRTCYVRQLTVLQNSVQAMTA
jgi:hypothetical protein